MSRLDILHNYTYFDYIAVPDDNSAAPAHAELPFFALPASFDQHHYACPGAFAMRRSSGDWRLGVAEKDRNRQQVDGHRACGALARISYHFMTLYPDSTHRILGWAS